MNNECAALDYAANQGPLPIYLLPSVQDAFDRGEKSHALEDPNAVCLLCLRRDMHAACLAWEAMVPNPSKQIHRNAVIPPPFTNMVDVPGGYRSTAMIPHASMIFSPAHMVGVSGEIKIAYCPQRKTFYFDQTAITCNPPSFMKSHDNMFTVTCNRLSCIYGKDRIDFTEPLALYAARHRFSDSSETAYRRCAEAYSLMAQENYHEAGLPALIGFYIDCHMPAVNFKGSIQHLYMHNLAPEHSSDFPECTYPCNSFIKEAYKAWHCHTYHEVMDVSIKLMRKGGPSPSSVRYVSGLLQMFYKKLTDGKVYEEHVCNPYS